MDLHSIAEESPNDNKKEIRFLHISFPKNIYKREDIVIKVDRGCTLRDIDDKLKNEKMMPPLTKYELLIKECGMERYLCKNEKLGDTGMNLEDHGGCYIGYAVIKENESERYYNFDLKIHFVSKNYVTRRDIIIQAHFDDTYDAIKKKIEVESNEIIPFGKLKMEFSNRDERDEKLKGSKTLKDIKLKYDSDNRSFSGLLVVEENYNTGSCCVVS